jgi:hypothetical protein
VTEVTFGRDAESGKEKSVMPALDFAAKGRTDTRTEMSRRSSTTFSEVHMFRFMIRFLRATGPQPACGSSARRFRPGLEVLDARTLPSALAGVAASEPPVEPHAAHVVQFGGAAGGVIRHGSGSLAHINVAASGSKGEEIPQVTHVELLRARSSGEEIPQT